MKTIVASLIALLLLTDVAMAQSCSTYPYTLTNGQPADATQVMADFGCAALTSGATLNATSFTGITTMRSPSTASDVLDLNNHSNVLNLEIREDTGSYLKEYLYDHTGATTNVYLGGEGSSFFLNPLTVGTSTSGGWNGNAELEADIPGSGYALSGYTTYTGGAGGGALLLRVDTTAVNFAALVYNGSGVGSITTNGSSTSYNTTSDERLKDWQIPQKSYRSAIEDIWVGDFRWKSTGQSDFGIRAQQAFPYFPTAIQKPSETGAQHWQADYSRFAPLALWGVKDLYQIVEKQDEQISDLKKRVVAFQTASDSRAGEIQTLRHRIETLERKLEVRTAQR